MDVYATIAKKSLKWLNSYKSDLIVHDKKTIENNPNIPFLHFTWNSGTYLMLLRSAQNESWPKKGEWVPYLFGHADREHILNQLIEVMPAIGQNVVSLIQYYDGKKVSDIGTMDAASRIIRDYIRRVQVEWDCMEMRKG